MHSEELERAKIDLETIRSIAGIVESPNREDLWLNLLTAIAGGLALAWVLLPHGLWQTWGLLAALAPFSYLVKLRWKYRASTGASPARRKVHSQDLAALWLAIPVLTYWWWAKTMGLRPFLILATVTFFIGLQILASTLGNKEYRYTLPWALALMIGGLLLPTSAFSPIAVLGVVLIFGGVGGAIVIRWTMNSLVRTS